MLAYNALLLVAFLLASFSSYTPIHEFGVQVLTAQVLNGIFASLLLPPLLIIDEQMIKPRLKFTQRLCCKLRT